jgi:septation ring formation regulator EzrA
MEERIKQNSQELNKLKDKCSTYDTCMALMQKDIEEIKDELTEIKRNQMNYMNSMEEFLEKVEQRKADKWVEKFAVSLISIFALSALYYIFQQAGLPHQ